MTPCRRATAACWRSPTTPARRVALRVSALMPSDDDVLTAYPLDDAGAPVGEHGDVHPGASTTPTRCSTTAATLVVGPDELLYLGLGDGRRSGRPARQRGGSGRTLLGKVVRIVPTPEEPEPYRIPPDNPVRRRARRGPRDLA